MEKVKCNWCTWVGLEIDLKLVTTETVIDKDRETIEVCPSCNKADCLMDIDCYANRLETRKNKIYIN